jgi:periplasmic protein TonB
MSYADHRRPRGPALAAAILVQGAVGYVLIAGLAYTMVPHRDAPIETYHVDEPPPPEPEPIKPQPQQRQTAPVQHLDVVQPPIPVITPPNPTPYVAPSDPTPFTADPGPISPPEPPQPPQPPAIDHSEGVSPLGNQGDWFPQDSYPGAALARGAEGRVSVTVSIGVDGRVSDCRVVSSSGDSDLDNATCRLAKRNGRFKPALDRDGHPVPSTTTLRNVRWEINGE